MFHQMSLLAGYLYIRNVLLPTLIGDSYPGDLDEGSIEISDLLDVQLLLSKEPYTKAFIATRISAFPAIKNQIPYDTPAQVLQALKNASEGNYWMKYLAVNNFDRHIVGQMVHSFGIVLAGLYPNNEYESHMSPALVAGEYEKALNSMSPGSKVLVIGAFSPYSVSEWYELCSTRGCELTIVDLYGGLSRSVALDYGVRFEIQDGLHLDSPEGIYDLVMTNLLFDWGNSPYQNKLDRRGGLLREMHRVLKKGGKIALVEAPLSDLPIGINLSTNLANDTTLLYREMMRLGFVDILAWPILPCSRLDANEFMRTGKMVPKQRVSPYASNALVSVSATKK